MLLLGMDRISNIHHLFDVGYSVKNIYERLKFFNKNEQMYCNLMKPEGKRWDKEGKMKKV